ncbi:unnamed protein product [Angiostrongylus costaricensis]|uniref:Uncharacterized protein n=1 Tax=Angiostrongylus costaricensis TaxID=334426 RepID=A0A0R3Q2S9_ANGCS|nr:unnamed protein product [Angiostrongylus costaricensis]
MQLNDTSWFFKEFIKAVEKFKKLRARFDQRQVLKHEFELLIRFEEETYPIWGLYQQVVVGNINVPSRVCSLEERLPDLIEEWKDDQDPRIPDRNRYVPEEERDEVERITREAKLARRQRDAAKRAEEEALGMWDE